MQPLKSQFKPFEQSRVVSIEQRESRYIPSNIVPSKIALPSLEGTRYIRFECISHCTSDNNYCKVVLISGESILLAKTLKWVEDRLPSEAFLRIHASHLVNADCVAKFCYDFVVLDDGSNIPVSKSRKAALQESLDSRCLI